MAGHNKWTQIRRQKEKSDAKKSQIFSKMAKSITAAAKEAKGNITDPILKAAIDRAHAFNMPNESIERAIKKASEAEALPMEEIAYEAYGPGGSALIIQTLTPNRNKAAQEIKHILSEQGYSLTGTGSAAWAFKKTGGRWQAKTTLALSDTDIAALEKLVEALEASEDVQEVFSNAE